MSHGGDIYRNTVNLDLSVSLNPLETPESVRDAVAGAIKRAGFYPDIEMLELRRAIARAEGIGEEYVYGGNGASELLMAAVRTVRPGRALLFEPGFSGYRHALRSVGCEIIECVLDEGEGFALSGDKAAALGDDFDMVFFCDPMNPSGKNIDEKLLLDILDRAREKKISVCLDESFFYMSEKALDTHVRGRGRLVDEYEDLMIIRSMTKLFSVPGVRMGYVLANPKFIEGMRRQLPEWNLSVFGEAGIAAGIKEIRGGDFLRRTMDAIRREREYISRGLSEIGFTVYESDTSFILFKGCEELYDRLLQRGILIRDCSDFLGLKKGFYRIGLRRHEDNERLLREIRGIVNED